MRLTIAALACLAAVVAGVSQERRAKLAIFDNAEIPLVHFPSRSSAQITEDAAAETLARVIGTSSPVAHSNEALPSGDLFNRPSVNLLLAIEDYVQNSSSKINSMTASAPTYSLTEAKDSIGFPLSMLHGTKQGEHGLPDLLQSSGSDQSKSMVFCASGSKVAASACDVGMSVSWNAKDRVFEASDGSVWATESDLQKALSAKHSLAGIVQAAGGDAASRKIQFHREDATVSFDLSQDVDLLFFLELYVFTSLPNRLFTDEAAAQRLTDSSTDLVSLTFSSLKTLGEFYGRDSNVYAVAQALVDEAAFKVVSDFKELLPEKLAVETLLIQPVQEEAVHAAASRRRLLAAADVKLHPQTYPFAVLPCISTATTECPPSAADIANWNIFFWSIVLLGGMLGLSLCGLFGMDVGRDSLLYAKFQTEIIDKHD